ncbi:gamma-glutamylcyclotransferase [Rhizobiales bacterium]|uniref:gamma-glutamylcyclotransferase n=1 Tax=Hongsoonwoonella zoysiae TaxID=2821844 RepID=UPI001560915E|nr:gamma-glutamylcyclotransferase [Hongsoonwoonella zoysiae]NRG18603.1 gamma-glutamylcyclotransferase [Hongsoonwoonella zoysiae]
MTITYFGYGSLVNRQTLSPESKAVPGELRGWVREWRVKGKVAGIGTGACALTVRREPEVSIRGVMVSEPASGLAALTKREIRYDRIDGIASEFHAERQEDDVPQDAFLYQAKSGHYDWGDADHPILQSYVDCVLAGFFDHWGEKGIDHFLATTDGWHVPILADRADPRYPRAVSLERELALLIDEKLSQVGVDYIQVSGGEAIEDRAL